jgi:hypothetical protein
MSSTFYLNVRRADVTNDWHDRVYAGFYRVVLTDAARDLPPSHQAACALDAFQTLGPIGEPEDYVIDVLDGDEYRVPPDANVVLASGQYLDSIVKRSDFPRPAETVRERPAPLPVRPGQLLLTSAEYGANGTGNVRMPGGGLGTLLTHWRMEIRRIDAGYAVHAVQRGHFAGREAEVRELRQFVCTPTPLADIGAAADYVETAISEVRMAIAEEHAAALDAQRESDRLSM